MRFAVDLNGEVWRLPEASQRRGSMAATRTALESILLEATIGLQRPG